MLTWDEGSEGMESFIGFLPLSAALDREGLQE